VRALALVLTAVLVAACTSDPQPSPSPVPSVRAAPPSTVVPLSPAGTGQVPASSTASLLPVGTPTAAPRPTAAPTTAPTAAPPAGGPPLAWARLGTISTGAGGDIDGVLRLAGGYVAWGTSGTGRGEDPPFTTWFSADGRSWERTVHATSIVPCPGWTARPDLEVTGQPASNGEALVFVATYLLPDADACDRAWVISLSTTDGRTWSRSKPFGTAHDKPAWAMWADTNWPIPTGWETVVSDGSDVATMWRTTDFATWGEVGTIPASSPENGNGFRVLATSPDGIRLGTVVAEPDSGEAMVLRSSSNGVDWADVRTLPPGFSVAAVVPPTTPGSPWLVAIEREEPEQARILVSTNLVDWSRSTMAKPGVEGLTDAGAGWATIGLWVAKDTGCGDSCRPERPSLYTSTDGVTWVNHPRSMPPHDGHLLAGAGDGVVVAGSYPSLGNVALWQLALER